jgi:selenocysteine-specific elongation factor
MKVAGNVVIGTAGHIDHGKTALVKLLTGVDTDRLKEEKERGISIDLGFAHLQLPSGIEAGIVDVPGHERFVRNMLAGAAGIDIVLFVIAADEGVMPQTSEHLDIVDILGVDRGVIALTKTDLVDDAWIEMVSSDVSSLVKTTVLESAPIVPVSSVSGKGKDETLKALDDAALRVRKREERRLLRLPVDRVFTVEGFGTVVTGTLWSGRVTSGDSLEIMPSGKRVRARNVQVFGRDVAEALPGQRVALALHGVSRDELARGDWVVTPDAVGSTSMMDVRFDLLKDVSRPLKNRSRVRFHLGASEIIGRIHFLDREELAPGQSAFAQLRLESRALAIEGDRFVVRSYSPQITIGGGTVLLPRASKHRRKNGDVLGLLTLVERGSPIERIEHAIRSGGKTGVPVSELPTHAGVEAPQAEQATNELLNAGRIRRIGNVLVHDEAFDTVKTEMVGCLRHYQKSHRLRWGMAKGELRNRLGDVSGELFSAVFDTLVGEEQVFVRKDRCRVDSSDIDLPPEEARLKEETERRILEAGFNVPLVKELASSDAAKKTIDILQILVEEGKLVKVTSELYFHSRRIEEAEKLLTSFLSQNARMQVAEFKDLIKSTRKYAVPLLEYFDKKGVTRRDGDVRVLGKA